MKMTELEQQHRIAMESLQIKTNADSISRGQQYGFAISIICLGLAGWTAIRGAPWMIPVAFIGIPMASVVRAFLNKR